MANRTHWWAAHAPWLLVATAAITLFAFIQLVDLRNGTLRLEIDPSLDAVSTQSASQRAFVETVHRRFGSTEAILVVLEFADVYTRDALVRIERLSRALAALAGVESVSSLTATAIPHLENEVLSKERVTAATLADPALPERLRVSTAGNPLVTGQLVSADGRAAAILVTPAPQSERELLRSDLAGRVLRTADAEAAPGVSVRVTGTPVIRSTLSATVARQMRRVVPAIVLVVTALLALAFPSLRGVLLPMATIAIGLLWTLATMSLLGKPLNLITALVPPLLVTMGLAYCAHILSEYEHLIRGAGPADPIDRIASLLREVALPVAVTGMTTIAGLLALLLNQQRAILEFAWLSALGTFYLMILSLCFVPAVLRYTTPRRTPRALPAAWLFETGSERLSRFDQRRRPLILGVAGVAFVVALLLASRIHVGDEFVGTFGPDTRVRMDYNAVNRLLGGVNTLDIVIDGGAADAFTDPQVLAALAELHTWLADQPEVGTVTSLVDHVKLLSRYLGGGDGVTIPTSGDAIKQMLFVGESELQRGVVNSDRSSTLFKLRLVVDDTAPITAFLDRLEPQLARLPRGFDAHTLGSAALMAQSVHTATAGQLQSVALALVLIYVCLSIQFMSPRVGLLAALPTVLQTAMYFGVLGVLNVPLNPTTVLVECLVLGLAIDDTIHYLARFNSAAKRSGSETIAAASALRAVLRPVTLTKAILAIGFLTMATGELRNQTVFGWLAALTLFCAWLVDAFVTPAFMSGLRIVTLWDTLRLNLGRDVQKTIPLFAGLSDRQARIFALMANLHRLPAGTRLMTEGDDAHSIYVVIDGELAVSVGRGTEQVELKRLHRGAVVGEVGYFGQKRTATVDAVTDVRLLRFDEADQDRICTAYPAIAARVFLTLNRLQARRLTEQVPDWLAATGGGRGRTLAQIEATEHPEAD